MVAACCCLTARISRQIGVFFTSLLEDYGVIHAPADAYTPPPARLLSTALVSVHAFLVLYHASFAPRSTALWIVSCLLDAPALMGELRRVAAALRAPHQAPVRSPAQRTAFWVRVLLCAPWDVVCVCFFARVPVVAAVRVNRIVRLERVLQLVALRQQTDYRNTHRYTAIKLAFATLVGRGLVSGGGSLCATRTPV